MSKQDVPNEKRRRFLKGATLAGAAALAASSFRGLHESLINYGAMREHAQRLALDLEIAVAHGDRNLLVGAGEEFRALVAAGLAAMYSKPSVLITSIMKSLPLLPRVSGSSAAGGAVSACAPSCGPRSRTRTGLWHRRPRR
jgi:hypothetical protein